MIKLYPMKRILMVSIIVMSLAYLDAGASDTLYYRFNNYIIKDASPYDTLIMEIDIRSSTTGTYLVACQVDLHFNTTAFGNNAQPVSVTHLEMVGPAMILSLGQNPTPNAYRYAISQLLPPYNPAFLSLVPSTSWGRLIRFKFLVLDNSQNTGMEFYPTHMTGNQRYVTNPPGSLMSYAPIVASNTLINLPSAPTNLNLMISELGDPSNSNADFVEVYNPGPNPVNFSQYPWYLTIYNGSTYQNIQLTGTLNTGDSYVLGGTSFTTAYPGKSADITSAIAEQNGMVSWYLTLWNPYSTGIFIDQYNGTALPFNGKHAVRRYGITAPATTFTTSQWEASPAANMYMTPGSHRATLTWDGSTGPNWADTANWTPPFIPDVGHNAEVPISIIPAPSIGTGTTVNLHNVYNGSGD